MKRELWWERSPNITHCCCFFFVIPREVKLKVSFVQNKSRLLAPSPLSRRYCSGSGLDLAENNSSLPPWPLGELWLPRKRFFIQSVRHRLFSAAVVSLWVWFDLFCECSPRPWKHEPVLVSPCAFKTRRACVPSEKPRLLAVWHSDSELDTPKGMTVVTLSSLPRHTLSHEHVHSQSLILSYI